MSKTTITVTFKVKLVLPLGGNAATAQQFVRNGIIGQIGGLDPANDPFHHVDREQITVALLKKEVVYG